jgi:hypothetical protein
MRDYLYYVDVRGVYLVTPLLYEHEIMWYGIG